MAYSGIFSIPVFRKHQASMRRRFIVFSSILFLLLFTLGSAAFIILMEQILHKNAGYELMQSVEIERLKLEAYVNSEIAIVLKMASSPLILRHFLNPNDAEIKKLAFEDIEGYRRVFASNSLFWVKDTDKEFWLDSEYAYTVNPDDLEYYWYNMTMYRTESYNINIDYDPSLKVTNLWINAPVFDSNHEPIGILGTGVNLSEFINAIYQKYQGTAELFFFNAAGEITGAKNIGLVTDKVNIAKELGQNGDEIFAESKYLRAGETKYFETKGRKGIASIGSIPALNWYITIIRYFTFANSLQTGMTILFGIMMAVILFVIIIFIIFIIRMLEPLNRMVKTIIQTLSDWELNPQADSYQKGEIETLGEFFNMTIIDQLTGIYNRRYFDGNLKKIIKSQSRTGGTLSLLMVDIDYFKKYNDTYGHQAGDNCLRIIAVTLSKCITRDEDFVARYGGEEFAVVLPNTDSNGAHFVAEKLREKVNECKILNEASDIAEYITISIGGTTSVVKHLQKGSGYVNYADKALYESKKNGRNRYTFVNFEE
jgi:diguanylate cyclase (GGDEF)-like protein